MKLNLLKIGVIAIFIFIAFESNAACERKKINCINGSGWCGKCGEVPPLGCATSSIASTLHYYVLCSSCGRVCSVATEGAEDEDGNKICGEMETSKDTYDDGTALFFELDLSESHDVLEELAKVHPEQAMKLLIYSREDKNKEVSVTNLKYTKYISDLMPSFEFFQLAINGRLEKIHAEKGLNYVESLATSLDNGTNLLVESWASLLPDGNIEIRTRSVVANVILPEMEYVPIEILAETVAIIEPVKNEKYLYRISSLEW